MNKTLIIVESPAKAKKLTEYLGPDFTVKASFGHVRDLPTGNGEIGYKSDTFEPVYEITERAKTTIKTLKATAKECSRVLLATDPDREGEAISWHLAELLGLKKRERIKFHEITATAVMKAINSPAQVDTALVRAQEARRIIDRQVGWLVSGPLSRKIGQRASAGRVQSPALALVVEREREIQAFNKEQFYTVNATFEGGWIATWPHDDFQCKDKTIALSVETSKVFTVKEYEEKTVYEDPPAPFRTSKLLQAASVVLGFDPKHTMDVAQQLFQKHGAISYHRTDESNISDEAFAMILAYGQAHDYPMSDAKRIWKGFEGAQEAHEAIRPTDMTLVSDDSMTADEASLYKLIHARALASQMQPAEYSVVEALLVNERGDTFKAHTKTIRRHGWRVLAVEDEEVDAQAEKVLMPSLSVGHVLTAKAVLHEEHTTRPPKRYTKASLTNALESLGIGRPATYANMVDGLTERAYVQLLKRFLVPEAIGYSIYDALKGYFSFIETEYTKSMESDLDSIVKGEKSYRSVVSTTHQDLTIELSKFGAPIQTHKEPPPVTGHICSKCRNPMIKRNGPRGAFLGCSTYPKCKETQQLKDGV